jgi:regulator of replication initiation timing
MNQNSEDVGKLIEQYTSILDQLFSKIVREYNKLQLADYTHDTLSRGNNLIKTGSQLLTALKSNSKTIETLLSDCNDFVTEIKEDMECPRKDDGYVFPTKNGMLSYPGKEFIVKLLNADVDTSATPPASTPPASTIKEEKTLIKEIGYYMKIPIVENLSDIPQAIYGHHGSLYLRLPNNNLARIPFPEVVDSKKEYDRKHSIRCKYKTKQECDAQRQKMAKIYQSNIRICNFAHEGDKMIKIGYPSRCPSVPNFGNPKSMSVDIRNVSINDIKNILLYGLSDIITASVWLDYSDQKNLLLSDLDGV